VSAVLIPRVLHLLDVQPDWARHALAAAMLFVALAVIVAGAIVRDRRSRELGTWRPSPRPVRLSFEVNVWRALCHRPAGG
jgi:hypothetical protein